MSLSENFRRIGTGSSYGELISHFVLAMLTILHFGNLPIPFTLIRVLVWVRDGLPISGTSQTNLKT